MAYKYIGKPIKRLEDPALLKGRGQFIDDIKLPEMVAMAIYRSPYAHAKIEKIDLSHALRMQGVLDAFSANELHFKLPEIPLRLAPFAGFNRFLQTPLAIKKTRYVGEPVAVIVAENRYLAEDALALIKIEFKPLAAVISVEEALAAETLIHEEAGENLGTSYTVSRGDCKQAFASADYIRKEKFITNRQGSVPLETRGLIADYVRKKPLLRLHGATKVNFFNRRHLAVAFSLPETAVELIETDIGGGFGSRGELYPEDYLVPIASYRIGRPVKWIEDRRENLLATNHSRDIVCNLEMAADLNGKILGMRATLQGDMGAFIRTNGGVVPSRAAQFLPGPYRVPAFSCDVQFLITNKTPVGTYRGPGRFEANFFRERLIDLMAFDLNIDPAEIRLKNLLTPQELPYQMGELVPGDPDATVDVGNYPATLKKLLIESHYSKWKERQETQSDRVVKGLGIACFLESSAAGPPEHASISVHQDGKIEVRTGASSLGQGLETALAQICAEFLDVDITLITVFHGSTNLIEDGGGTFHSRNTVMAGNAARIAAENLKSRAMELAALRWNCDKTSLKYVNGKIKTESKVLSLGELAIFAESRNEKLSAEGSYDNNKKLSYSYGAHAALVAVDIETGEVELERYVLIEEIGRTLNPMLVEGQAVGGVVQGIGGTLLDHMIYDAEGQLLTTNLADYLLPISVGLPPIKAITMEEYPSQLNPMGFKGAGEGGIVAVAAAVSNAVGQALKEYNLTLSELPLTPIRLREGIQGAQRRNNEATAK